MTDGREQLYLRAGMSDADLFREFNSRNPYYRHIASQLVAHAARIAGGKLGQVVDVLGRTGYLARAAQAAADGVRILEHRKSFADYLANEFAAEPDVIVDPTEPRDFSVAYYGTILCCEQASLLQPYYADFVKRLTVAKIKPPIFGMTLGPSHHHFRTHRIADHRSGEVRDGEVMSELSHPIKQAVHREVVRLTRARYGFDREDAWPPAAKAFDPQEVRAANEEAGFRHLAIIEETFAVPGHQIFLYEQNAWTFYMRWPPLSELAQDAKIALLNDAIESVRAMSEYDGWCKEVTAFHPVAYYLAW